VKSPYQIAKELNVSPQAVYKRMTDEFTNQFTNHIQRTEKGKYKLDEVAEQGLKELFNRVVQPINLIEQPIDQFQQSEDTFSLYKHTVPNGKVYIGITSLKPYTRWGGGSGYKQNEDFYKDITEFGWDNIEHTILANGLDMRTAEIEENRLILECESYDPEKGYNKQFKLLNYIRMVEQQKDPLLNQLNTENDFLRSRVEALENELKTERTHSREQTGKLSDLAAQLAELTRNNQVLLGAEQSRTNPALLMGGESAPLHNEEQQPPKGFFQRFFKR